MAASPVGLPVSALLSLVYSERPALFKRTFALSFAVIITAVDVTGISLYVHASGVGAPGKLARARAVIQIVLLHYMYLLYFSSFSYELVNTVSLLLCARQFINLFYHNPWQELYCCYSCSCPFVRYNFLNAFFINRVGLEKSCT